MVAHSSNRTTSQPRMWLLAALCVALAGSALAQTPNGGTRTIDPERARRIKHRELALPSAAPALLPEVVVALKPGVDPFLLSAGYGMRVGYRFLSDPRIVTLLASDVETSTLALAALRNDTRVRAAYPSYAAEIVKDAFTPNDPYFPKDSPASGWPGQWHLVNTVTAGLDAGVAGAWARDIVGQGVIVGIVDDGMQTTHPDLNPNYTATNSYDFGQGDTNPNPVFSDDVHGTAVAGLIAARGGNGIGVTGVAPNSALAALRIDFGSDLVTTMAADATLYRSSGATTTIKVKNHSYGPASPYIASQLEVDALATSTAAGTIHVRSAGNARGTIGEDANKSAIRNTPDAITVAAIGSDGTFADYSNFGANVMACAPSHADRTGTFWITTTDRTGEGVGYNGGSDSFPDPDYTSVFGGTSAASPIVAGVMALGKQVQPALNTRFAKHLLARTCDVVDASDATASSDGGWKTNKAGLKFNQNYGFGLIDADRFTQAAVQYQGVTPLETETVPTVTVNAGIPDNLAAGVSRSFSIASSTPLEEMRVTIKAAHTWRGDLEALLASPRGTVSRLLIQAGSDNGDGLDWTFTTNAFWGENPKGTWSLKLIDTFAGDTGTWESFGVTARMGQLIPAVRTVSGKVALGDWSGEVAGRTVAIQIVDGANVLETKNVVLDAAGAYSFETGRYGTYDLVAKGSHWLSRRRASVNLFSGATAQDFALVNGDVDGDDAVTVFDYNALSEAFDSTLGDANWNAEADLDGDGAVTVFDYNILSANFDLVGE